MTKNRNIQVHIESNISIHQIIWSLKDQFVVVIPVVQLNLVANQSSIAFDYYNSYKKADIYLPFHYPCKTIECARSCKTEFLAMCMY